jgi:N-acetylglucosaminyldiphosphoundecaprenol N-acetyl-beta-D-mannosaminyltransferase
MQTTPSPSVGVRLRASATTVEEDIPRFDVLGSRISALTLDRTVGLIRNRIANRAPGYICVCNVNDVVEALKSPELQATINEAWLATPDGMPLVWWGKRAGFPHMERVYGPDLLRAVITNPRHAETTHFFYGASPAVVDKMIEGAKRINETVKIVGKICPPFRSLTAQEETEFAEAINSADPDIVWVGLGCPKQNLWMAKNRSRLRAPVLIGVGAAFDFLAGVKSQAPGWMQRNGLEWLFRLVTEPRRLWKRYLIHNTIFVTHTLAHLLGLKRSSSPPQEEQK